MFNEIVLGKLHFCIEHIEAIEKYTNGITSSEQFIQKNEGLTYDGSLMRLQALTEMLKKISTKHPEVIEQLNYPEITDVIKFRDYASHHYELLVHEVVFSIVQTELPKLKYRIMRLLS